MLFLSLLLLASPLVVSAHGGHHHHHGHEGHDHHDHHHHGAETSPSGEDVHSTWGQYAWRSLAEGKAESAATGKPMLLLVWKTWCGACKSLRPRFASSAAIAAEASNFVMVNVVDDEEPADAMYKPEDAGYSAYRCDPCRRACVAAPGAPALTPSSTPCPPTPVPRILFFSKEHKLLDVSSGNDKYKFFYGDDGAIAGAMRRAAVKAAAAAPPAELASEDL